MLETKIDKLTKAIEALTAAIEAQQNQTEQPKNDVSLPGNDDSEGVTPTLPPTLPPSETPITHEEVKDLCLKISRADRTKKPAIKALIAEYGATVVTQVAAESLGELKAKLEGLV